MNYVVVAGFFAFVILVVLVFFKCIGLLAFSWWAVLSPIGALLLAQSIGFAWLYSKLSGSVDEGRK